MTNNVAMSIKHLLWNQWTDGFETRYVTLGTQVISIFSNNDLGLTLTFYGTVKHKKMIKHKTSLKVLKLFSQECSNDDHGLTVTFLARSNFLFRLLYGKSSWNL